MDSKYILTPSGTFVNTDEFYHHGIKGMKWGVRRYQNADGSLTAAGKKRRRSSNSEDVRNMSTDELRRKVNRLQNEQRYVELTKSSGISKGTASIERATKTATDINKVYKSTKGENNPYSKIAGQTIDATARTARVAKKVDDKVQTKRATEKAQKKLASMSDSELMKEVERLNLEQQYSRLQTSSIQKGKTNVSEVLDTVGDIVGITASAVGIAVGIKKLMK